MDLDLRAYARILRKRKWLIVAVLLGCIGLGTLITVQTPPKYTAETTLFVGERQVAIEDISRGVVVQDLSARLLKSYVEIVKSRTIAQRAAVDGRLEMSPGDLQRDVSAYAVLETYIIKVGFTAEDPALAQRTANAVAEAFVNEIGRLAVREVDGEPAVEVSIIDRAVLPDFPISPNTSRNFTLSVLIGLVLSIGLAFVIEHLDVTLKTRDEVESLGLVSLGSIPRLDTRGATVYIERDTQTLAGEAFRKVRTSIGFMNLETPTRSILVTSALAQEGKTTTAVNLAVAYALGGLRTILVEADLRRPSLHRVYGMVAANGLTTAIVGEVPLNEAIMTTETRNLSVLVAGAIPPNPVELLGSEQMTQLVETLERTYDIVIIDSPPVAPVADPAALAGRCDGVVLVTRAGKTDRGRLLEAARVIERAGGRLLGVVLNFQKSQDTPYDYEYYQGSRTPATIAAAEETR